MALSTCRGVSPAEQSPRIAIYSQRRFFGFGISDFSGAWNLGFGAFYVTQTHYCSRGLGQIPSTELTSLRACDTLAAWQNQLWAEVWARFSGAHPLRRNRLYPPRPRRRLRPFRRRRLTFTTAFSTSRWAASVRVRSSREKTLLLMPCANWRIPFASRGLFNR